MSSPAHIVVDLDDGVPWGRVPPSELADEWTADRIAPTRSETLPVLAAAAVAALLALFACVLG